nr:hypothetical protein [Virgisporangium ochraceum]
MATRCDDEVASGLHTTTRVDTLVGKVRAGAWQRRARPSWLGIGKTLGQ